MEPSPTALRLLDLLQGWIRSRWGRSGAFLVAVLVASWGAWTQREHIAALPGVMHLLAWSEKEPSPKPVPDKFNLAVAVLGNDPAGEMRRLVLDELGQFGGVAVLSPGERIETRGGIRRKPSGQDMRRRGRCWPRSVPTRCSGEKS